MRDDTSEQIAERCRQCGGRILPVATWRQRKQWWRRRPVGVVRVAEFRQRR